VCPREAASQIRLASGYRDGTLGAAPMRAPSQATNRQLFAKLPNPSNDLADKGDRWALPVRCDRLTEGEDRRSVSWPVRSHDNPSTWEDVVCPTTSVEATVCVTVNGILSSLYAHPYVNLQ